MRIIWEFQGISLKYCGQNEVFFFLRMHDLFITATHARKRPALREAVSSSLSARMRQCFCANLAKLRGNLCLMFLASLVTSSLCGLNLLLSLLRSSFLLLSHIIQLSFTGEMFLAERNIFILVEISLTITFLFCILTRCMPCSRLWVIQQPPGKNSTLPLRIASWRENVLMSSTLYILWKKWMYLLECEEDANFPSPLLGQITDCVFTYCCFCNGQRGIATILANFPCFCSVYSACFSNDLRK